MAVDNPARHLSYALLTPQQAEDRGKRWKGNYLGSRLSVFDLVRKSARLHRTLAMHKRILVFLADNEVTGVRRVLCQGLREGMSEKALLFRLEQAFTGKYRAAGYSDRDYDLAILALRLGGQALLYSLHQAAGFPGVTTVYEKMRDRSVSFTNYGRGRV